MMISGLFSNSVISPLIRSSNCPRYLEPATIAVRSTDTILLLNKAGEVCCFTISCASPSTIALLPTPGSPMSMGLFFFLRPMISKTLWISCSLPTTGSNFPSLAALVKSVLYLSKNGVLLLCICPVTVLLAVLEDADESLSGSLPFRKKSSSSSLGKENPSRIVMRFMLF